MIKVIPTWVWLAAIGLAAVVGTGLGYGAGHDSAALDCKNSINAQLEQRWQSYLATEREIARVTRPLQREAAAATVQTEEAIHATQTRIQVVYRDRPAPSDCSPDPGVRNEIDAAHAAAAGAVRAAAGLAPAAVPERDQLPGAAGGGAAQLHQGGAGRLGGGDAAPVQGRGGSPGPRGSLPAGAPRIRGDPIAG